MASEVGGSKYDQFAEPIKKADSVNVDNASTPDSIPEIERPPLRKIDQYIRPELPYLSKRATVAVLSCMGFIIMFGMRTSMGIVRAEMNQEWDPETMSAVEGAVFWGYFITQIPGGLIAAAYPANKLFGYAIGTSSCLNLLIPFLYDNPNILIVIKVLQGLVEGVTYPSCHGIMRHWAPPLERSRLATLAFSGCYAGVMFAMLICGELIEHFGKLAPFYFYGVVGILWYLSWLWLVFEKPAYHTCIDTKELLFIENSLGEMHQKYMAPTLTNTPWKEFFTSMPCYAIFVANFCRSWNFYLLVLFQTSMFQDTFHAELTENTILGSLPHLLMTIIVPSGGILADRLRKRGILNTTQVRKLFNCGGFGMEATFFLVMAYSHNITQGTTALSIGVAFSGFAISGFNVNHLDIAPRYASILMGLSNGIGTIAGAIIPHVVHAIVKHKKKEEWREVLIIAALVHYSGIIFYGIFASGDLQPWADPNFEEEKQWNQMNEGVPIKNSTSQNNGALQRQLTGGISNYGSVETALPSSQPPQRPAPPVSQFSQEGRPSANPFHQQEATSFIKYQQEEPPSYQYAAAASAPSMAGKAGSFVRPPQAPVVPAINPFTSSANPFRQEAVQPEAQDQYLHGSISDRTY